MTELTCITPLWPYTEALTLISVFQRYLVDAIVGDAALDCNMTDFGACRNCSTAANQNCSGNSCNASSNGTCHRNTVQEFREFSVMLTGFFETSFEFFTVWQSKSRAIGVAKGGHEVVVFGVGFDELYTGYRCLFTGAGSAEAIVTAESVAAEPSQDHRSLRCIVPFWNYSAQVAALSVTADDGHRTIVYFDETRMVDNTTFEFVQGWDAISEHVGPASGRTGLAITAYGLTVGSSEYSCVFTRGNSTMETSISVVSSVLAECDTSVWGSMFPADGGRVLVSVVTDGVVLDYTAGSLEAATCGNETICSLEFFQVWNGTSSGSPSNGSASGGSVVTIEGYGFDPAAEYYCNFTTLHGEWAVSRPVFATSVTELTCITPLWKFKDALTYITLHEKEGGEVVKDVAFDHAVFHFIHRWFHPIEDFAPAKGGKLLTILGDGFHKRTDYQCKFSQESQSAESPAKYISNSEVSCEMPQWRYPGCCGVSPACGQVWVRSSSAA